MMVASQWWLQQLSIASLPAAVSERASVSRQYVSRKQSNSGQLKRRVKLKDSRLTCIWQTSQPALEKAVLMMPMVVAVKESVMMIMVPVVKVSVGVLFVCECVVVVW